MRSQVSPQPIAKQRRCPYCFREFSKNDHYNRHLRSHTKEKPYRCVVCGHHYPRRDTLLRHIRIHDRDPDTQRWQHTFADDHSVQDSCQPPPNPQDLDPTGVCNASEDASLTDTTTCNHTQRAFSSSTVELSTGTTDPASSWARAFQENPGQVTSGIDVGNMDLSFGASAMSDCSEAPTLPNLTVRQESVPENLSQGHQNSNFSETVGASASGSADYSLDPSDWLLENEFFDLFDFGSLQTGPLEGQTRERAASPPIRDLRDVWFVPVARTDLDPETTASAPSNKQALDLRADIDEAYRADMATTLLPRLRNEPLPSIDLLNVCIRLFFTRINVMLPLVHGPTFRATPSNTLLVLSMCSAGTLAMESGNAAKLGCALFERVNKSGMTLPWERVVSRQLEQARSNLKVAAIGQIFALLSREPTHRMIGNSFHGGMIASSRHLKLFDEMPPLELDEDMSAEDLDKVWRTWVRDEEMKRFAIILYIQDAELAALFHQEPNFRHNTRPLPVASSAELFAAPTAAAWAVKYRVMQKQKDSRVKISPESTKSASDSGRPMQLDLRHQPDILNSHAVLSGVGATISEFRRLDLLSSTLNSKLGADLVQWYTSARTVSQVTEGSETPSEPPLSLRILWHYTFMSLSVDLNTLEIASGREGRNSIGPAVHEYVRSWASALDSKRTLFHALFFQNSIVLTNLGSSTAIHTARVLFSAALCWYCYILYRPPAPTATETVDNAELDKTLEYLTQLPELQLLRMQSGGSGPTSNLWHKTMASFQKILVATPAEIKESTLCVLELALRGLGTSGISRRFADLIYIFISGEMDK